MKSRVLRVGELRFQADELGQGPLVILLHGFPDHRGTWRHQLPALAAAGFHAVAPSLRGYEASSQPRDRQYRVAHLAEDVAAWIDALGAPQAHLVGHDWGAVVAMAAANHLGDRVASLATLTVPPLHRISAMIRYRPGALGRLWYMALFQSRFLPERLLKDPEGRLVRRLWRDWSPSWSCPEAEMREVIRAMRQPGVGRAALSYYRQLPDCLSQAGRRSWALLRQKVQPPTLALRGAEDGCIDPAVYEVGLREEDFARGVQSEVFEGVGHFLHQEAPERFNERLITWLREQL